MGSDRVVFSVVVSGSGQKKGSGDHDELNADGAKWIKIAPRTDIWVYPEVGFKGDVVRFHNGRDAPWDAVVEDIKIASAKIRSGASDGKQVKDNKKSVPKIRQLREDEKQKIKERAPEFYKDNNGNGHFQAIYVRHLCKDVRSDQGITGVLAQLKQPPVIGGGDAWQKAFSLVYAYLREVEMLETLHVIQEERAEEPGDLDEGFWEEFEGVAKAAPGEGNEPVRRAGAAVVEEWGGDKEEEAGPAPGAAGQAPAAQAQSPARADESSGAGRELRGRGIPAAAASGSSSAEEDSDSSKSSGDSGAGSAPASPQSAVSGKQGDGGAGAAGGVAGASAQAGAGAAGGAKAGAVAGSGSEPFLLELEDEGQGGTGDATADVWGEGGSDGGEPAVVSGVVGGGTAASAGNEGDDSGGDLLIDLDLDDQSVGAAAAPAPPAPQAAAVKQEADAKGKGGGKDYNWGPVDDEEEDEAVDPDAEEDGEPVLAWGGGGKGSGGPAAASGGKQGSDDDAEADDAFDWEDDDGLVAEAPMAAPASPAKGASRAQPPGSDSDGGDLLMLGGGEGDDDNDDDLLDINLGDDE